jgi:phospholipase/carboxylesterase
MPIEIDPDAVLWSVGPTEREGRPLLIAMHGRGSDEQDLFSLAGELPAHFVIASLRAPVAEGAGWSWWEPGGANLPGDPAAENVDAAADAVLTWVDSLAFTPSQLGTLGFSQGGAMALHVLRRAASRIAFAVDLAGFVVEGEQASDAVLAVSKPPVFWGRGSVDPLFTPELIARTAPWLPLHATAHIHVYPGLGHSISREELDDVVKFLTDAAAKIGG